MKIKLKSSLFYRSAIVVLSLLLLSSNVFSNNLQISNLSVNQNTQVVNFTVTWDNSWNIDGVGSPNNWDAIWVFVKFRDCSTSGLAYTHGLLSSTLADHTIPATLDAMTSVDGVIYTESTTEPATLDETEGIMFRPHTAGYLGTTTGNVSLKISNMPGPATTLSINVFAIEMVYIKKGNFYIGDANGAGGGSVARFCSTPATVNALPEQITSAFETGPVPDIGIWTGAATTVSSVPAAWPKGQDGFYIMKYEISQGAYAEFLNTLTSVQQATRYPNDYGLNRDQLQLVGSTYSSSRPDRAMNWLAWADVAAFLDWACLRPMTEFEYEKSCRGSSGGAVTNEYAWGSTTILPNPAAALTFAGSAVENGTETTTAGYAVYGNINPTWSNGDGGQGPGRSGLFATTSSTRITAGASYYGVMELSGNLREPTVCLVTPAANNVFTRNWGDGNLDINGNPNAATWPIWSVAVAATVFTNLVGHRGGSWMNLAPQLQVSDRSYVYTAPVISQQNYNGGRGVR
jgi:formylglycine-generating enzyme required for sulfatase activity